MQAVDKQLIKFLGPAGQFIVPIYQRTYSWSVRECEQLWHDIVNAGSNPDAAEHFLGSVVYVDDGENNRGFDQVLVIDGQQRLTSTTLLLIALADEIRDVNGERFEPFEGFSPAKIRNRYLTNADEDGDKVHKLLLSAGDRETLTALIDARPLPPSHSARLVANLDWFRRQIASDPSKVEVVCRGLAKLRIVDVKLTRGQDNPQLVFESMNSTGKKLSQADLIRNFVLMGLAPKFQTRMYNSYWRPTEVEFGQAAYDQHFDGFVRHYLTVKTGEIPRIGDVYEAFKAFAAGRMQTEAGVEELLAEFRRYATFFASMALGAEENAALADAFADVREFGADVVYPMFLAAYASYHSGETTLGELVQLVRVTESYVMRRAVCAIPTNSLNTTFSSLSRRFAEANAVEQVIAELVAAQAQRRFPTDEEFTRTLEERDTYSFKRKSLLFRKLENYGRKEPVTVENYTIEHIMPQADELHSEWIDDLGPEWQRVHESHLHRLGNLTLTGYNSEYGARPFRVKRDLAGGFRDSPLALNEGLGALAAWNEREINRRGEALARRAAKVWPLPQADPLIVAQLRTNRGDRTSYTLEQHPGLVSGRTAQLFEALRQEVLALNPTVWMDVLKHYVAFKADSNFLDVVPRKSWLRLSLVIPIEEPHDPRGAAKDVSGVGHTGNGETELRFEHADDLPYAMGLVRQAFDRQLGE